MTSEDAPSHPKTSLPTEMALIITSSSVEANPLANTSLLLRLSLASPEAVLVSQTLNEHGPASP